MSVRADNLQADIIEKTAAMNRLVEQLAMTPEERKRKGDAIKMLAEGINDDRVALAEEWKRL